MLQLARKTRLGRRILGASPHTVIKEDPPHHSPTPVYTLDDADVVMGLKDPIALHHQISRQITGVPGEAAELAYKNDLMPIPQPEQLWTTESEKIIHQTSKELVDLLDTYQPEELGGHIAFLDHEFMTKYLYQNTLRVVRCHEMLKSQGLQQGSILEIGSYFGSFALAFKRLGYEVTAVDRYDSYGSAFSGYMDLIKHEGINVVSTSRENEHDMTASLGEFDAVISMAVVEHIPHTPRLFLKMLKDHIRPGGIVAMDTPNVARWWNVQHLSEGQTVFQDLSSQFHCTIPYEGHHREYTGAEIEWMLNEMGFEGTKIDYFDFNLLQFQEVDRPHIRCFLDVVTNPKVADTILASGKVPLDEC